MKHYRKLQLLLVMFSTATFGMAQSDSTKVQNDSITWNQSAHRNRPFCVTPSGRWGFFVQNKVRYFWKYRK